MYLEISPRQSGKSTRLVKELVGWAKKQIEGDRSVVAYVYTCTAQSAKGLATSIVNEMTRDYNTFFDIQGWSTLSDSNGVRISSFSSTTNKNYAFHVIGGNDSKPIEIKNGVVSVHSVHRRFFDEFDFIPQIVDELLVEDTDYYCTTPSKVRTLDHANLSQQLAKDKLLYLWVYNKCKYVRFPSVCKLNDQSNQIEVFGTFLNIKQDDIAAIAGYNSFEASAKPVQGIKRHSGFTSEDTNPCCEKAISETCPTTNAPTADAPATVLILTEGDPKFSKLKETHNASIVLRYYESKKKFYVIKNRYGTSRFWLPGHLFNKFIVKPTGKLEWV